MVLKNRWKRTLSQVLCAVVASSVVSSCGPATSGAGSAALVAAKAELEKGKTQLGNAEYLAAKNTLEPLISDNNEMGIAVADNIDVLDQARYTFVLANSLNQINDWVSTTATLFGILQTVGVLAPGFQIQGGGGLAAPTIDALLKSFIDFFDNMADLLSLVEQNPKFNMTLAHVPLKFNALGFTLLDMKGEYDLGEAFFLESVYRFASATLKAFLATDYTINPSQADSFGYLLKQFSSLNNDKLISFVSNSLGVVLHTQKKLLGLADATVMQDSGTAFAQSFSALGNAFEFMSKEIADDPDQTDDVVGWLPGQGGEPNQISLNLDFSAVPLPGFDTNKLDNLKITVSDNVLEAVDNITKAFEGDPNAFISWKRDLVPILAVVTVAVLRSGVVDGFIQATLTSSGLEGAQLDSITGLLNSNIVNENLVEGVLLGVIGDVLEFHVGDYFKNPTSGLRDWLPFWTPPAKVTQITKGKEETVNDFSAVHLLIEFECDDSEFAPQGDSDPTNFPVDVSGVEQFLCNATEVDVDHFTEGVSGTVDALTTPTGVTDFEAVHSASVVDRLREMRDFTVVGQKIGDVDSDAGQPCLGNAICIIQPPTSLNSEIGVLADGIKSPLGLVGFKDPSFGGILYIRLDPVPSGLEDYDFGAAGFFPATNRTLNALFQSIFGGILGLIGG